MSRLLRETPAEKQRETPETDSTRPEMAAEEAPAAAVKVAVQKKRKAAAATKNTHGPSIPKLILGAVADDKGRRGTSVWAIKKILGGKGVPVKEAAVNRRINKAVVKLVADGKLVQVRGHGASGSFKLAKLTKAAPKPAKPAKKAVKKVGKVKKPATKKSPKKKPAAKKATTTKKSPKKAARKPAAKKRVKPAVKKPAVKKAAKKSPAKKVPAKKAAKKSKK